MNMSVFGFEQKSTLKRKLSY